MRTKIREAAVFMHFDVTEDGRVFVTGKGMILDLTLLVYIM